MLTIGTPVVQFNHWVVIDTMFLSVDESTRFVAVSFLKNQSTKQIGTEFLCCGSIVIWSQDNISVDEGTAYVSKEMKEKAEASVIKMVEAPIEISRSIGIVKCYNVP